MSLDSARAFLAVKAPDIEILELESSTATMALPAGGALNNPAPGRLAELVEAAWVGVCKLPETA